MTASQSLVLYHHPTPTTTTTTTTLSTQHPRLSLLPSTFFTQQTGTAIATELLYRLLFDLLQRFLTTFQRLAAKSLDEASSWLERKLADRRSITNRSQGVGVEEEEGGGGGIVHQVSKLAAQRGFITCPMTGANVHGGGPQPPRWVRGVLEGIEEGRMEEKDFWIHTHTG
jgi:hypothetical protein